MCDSCRHFKDGPFCVETCPTDDVKRIYKYPDENSTCQYCHTNCREGCVGPENNVGPNGCLSCDVSIANQDETQIVECLNETQSCPSGYFAETKARGALSHLSGKTVSR